MLTFGTSKPKVMRKHAVGNRSDVRWQHAIDVDKNSRKM